MAQYCGMYPDIAAWNPSPAKTSSHANAVIDGYITQLAPGAIRLSSPFASLDKILLKLGEAMTKTGRHRQWLGNDGRLTLRYCLSTAENIPPVWIMQGTDDHIMPKDAIDELVARIRQARPKVPVLYSVQPGDHSFDSYHGLDKPYIKEGVDFVRKYWL
ncbi:MAG: hypothetical protein M1818_003255 [Claussenomyces sp. TS43310]|nr:MAG: hypothetical protein M1818_003255 [Claussenomyces sp. TS43310]